MAADKLAKALTMKRPLLVNRAFPRHPATRVPRQKKILGSMMWRKLWRRQLDRGSDT
jgi:hypothetical protein